MLCYITYVGNISSSKMDCPIGRCFFGIVDLGYVMQHPRKQCVLLTSLSSTSEPLSSFCNHCEANVYISLLDIHFPSDTWHVVRRVSLHRSQRAQVQRLIMGKDRHKYSRVNLLNPTKGVTEKIMINVLTLHFSRLF